MSDSNLSPKSIINFLKFKWVRGSKGSPRIVFKLPEANDSPIEPETFTDKVNQQKENSEAQTLGQLDTMIEHDSTPKKGSKGILKDPKKSRVLQQPQSAIDQDLQSSQNARLSSVSQLISHAESMNLNESKTKKVTFSSDTKNTEAKRNLRYVRIKRRVPVTPQTIQTDNQPFEPSSDKLLTPRAEPVSSGAPRNIFKITRTSDLGKNPKFSFNVNVSSKQQSNDVEGSKKNLLKIPSFEKVLESDTPIKSYPSLQAMLENSPISPVNSDIIRPSRPLVGSLSARNAVVRSPWDAYFQERENASSLTPRTDELKPRGRREKNLDYYAELIKKNPLLSPYQPSRPDSKAGLRPSSKNGSQANIPALAKRDFMMPIMNLPPERL